MNAPILVPLDGSLLAEQAIPFAEAFAAASQSPLLLLCASYVSGLPGMDIAEEQVRELADAERYLRGVAARLAGHNLTIETCVPYGLAGPSIVQEANIRGAQMIAMATHARGSLGRFVYGSVAEEVVRDSSVPVLLLRAWHAGDFYTRLARPGALVVPLDGSALAEAALPMAESLAAMLHAEVVLISAVPSPDIALTPGGMSAALFPTDRATAEREANAYLERVAVRLRAAGIVATTVVRTGAPANVVAAVAEERGAALTILTTHGRTGLDRLMLGSVAEAIVRHGATPVLLMKPEATDLAAAEVAEDRLPTVDVL